MKKKNYLVFFILIMVFSVILSSCNEKEHKHNLKHITRKEATCLTEGNIEYYHCSDCKKNYLELECINEISLLTINKIDHRYKWVVDKKATEYETGLKHLECESCHDIKNSNTIIDKIHIHNLELNNKKESTCLTEGNIEYYDCIECEKNFEDPNGTIEIENIIISRTEHNILDGKCTVCNCLVTKGLKYSLIDEGYMIVGIEFSEVQNIAIPKEYKGLKVIAIGELAFAGYNNLTSIIIPESVVTVLDNAFMDCNMLTIYCESNTRPIGLETITNPIYIYSENPPINEGNYWHFVNDIITKW